MDHGRRLLSAIFSSRFVCSFVLFLFLFWTYVHISQRRECVVDLILLFFFLVQQCFCKLGSFLVSIEPSLFWTFMCSCVDHRRRPLSVIFFNFFFIDLCAHLFVSTGVLACTCSSVTEMFFFYAPVFCKLGSFLLSTEPSSFGLLCVVFPSFNVFMGHDRGRVTTFVMPYFPRLSASVHFFTLVFDDMEVDRIAVSKSDHHLACSS